MMRGNGKFWMGTMIGFLYLFMGGCRGTITPPPSMQIIWNDPLDAAGLRAKYPELRGRIFSAQEYWDELAKKPTQEGPTEYRLVPNIRLRIEVVGQPDMSRTVLVRPDQMVDLPLVGEVRAGGKTIDEFKMDVTEKLVRFLRKPQVLVNTVDQPFQQGITGGKIAVLIASGGQQTVLQGGAVGSGAVTGSTINYTGVETLSTILGQIGLNDGAEWRQARIIRKNPKDPRKGVIILANLFMLLKFADFSQDIPLQPGDFVMIPARWNPGVQFAGEWNLWLQYLSGAQSYKSVLNFWQHYFETRF